MSSNQDIMEKRHAFTDCDDKYICKVRRNDHNYRQVYEYDKKLKREIANSNERRRMQSINLGFETLKQLLPMTMEGEKLSKASILQFTAKYIQSLIARLTTLEKEVASYKKNMLNNKEKLVSSKPSSVMQEQNRKRRLNSCTVDFEIAQNSNDIDPNVDNNNVTQNPSFVVLNNAENASMNCQASEKTPGSLEHLVAAIEQVEGEKFYINSHNEDVQSEFTIKEEMHSDSSSITESNNEAFEISEIKPDLVEEINTDDEKQSQNISNNSAANSTVMKPTISPYTEKIILAVSQHPHMFDNRISNYSLNMASPSPAGYQIISSNDHQLIESNATAFNRHLVTVSQRISIPHKYLHRPDVVSMQKNHTL